MQKSWAIEDRSAGKEREVKPPDLSRKLQAFLYPALIILGSALFLFPFTRLLHRVGDEGIIIYGAHRVSQGAVPYRDFREILGPASFYWLGSFFKVFGDSWQVARGHLLMTGVGLALVTWLIARRVVGGIAALVPFLFVLILDLPLWPASNHHWDSDLFVLLAVFCFLRREGRQGRVWLVASGILCGVAACFMPQKGVYVEAALMGALFLQNTSLQSAHLQSRRDALHSAGWLAASFALVGLAVIAAFWTMGALPDLIHATLIWPLTSYSGINDVPYGFSLLSAAWGPWSSTLRALPAVLSLPLAVLAFAPFLFIAILPCIAVVLAAVRWWKPVTRQAMRNNAGGILVLAGIALWISEIHRRDVFHLIYGAPLLILAVYALAERSRFRVVVSGVLAIGLLLAAAGRIAECRSWVGTETRRGTVLSAAHDQALEFLNQNVPRGEYVFVYPYYPLYYYLADVRNPIPFGALVSYINTPADFDECLRDIQAKQVRYVLWDTLVDGENLRRWFPGYRGPSAGQLRLERYLSTAYDVVSVKNGFRILKHQPTYAAR